MRAAAWFTSSRVCPGLWALARCSVNATVSDGFTSGWNGNLQTEHRFIPPSSIKWGVLLRVSAAPNLTSVAWSMAACALLCAASDSDDVYVGLLYSMPTVYAETWRVQALWISNCATTLCWKVLHAKQFQIRVAKSILVITQRGLPCSCCEAQFCYLLAQ